MRERGLVERNGKRERVRQRGDRERKTESNKESEIDKE